MKETLLTKWPRGTEPCELYRWARVGVRAMLVKCLRAQAALFQAQARAMRRAK